LLPISEHEYDQIETTTTKFDGIRERLVYGHSPELIHLKSQTDMAEYLREIVNSYLLKDILTY